MELLRRQRQPDWHWFEEELSYDNAKLAHALILSGHATGQQAVLERGSEGTALADAAADVREGPLPADRQQRILPARRRRAPTSTSSPSKRRRRSRPVSKPIAPPRTSAGTSTPSAPSTGSSAGTISAWSSTRPSTGGCRDGLHVDRVNGNQGAESTLAFLLSLAEMQLAQNILTSFKEPIAVQNSRQPRCPSTSNALPTILHPDQSRVLLRPFNPGSPERAARIIARIMAIPEEQVAALLRRGVARILAGGTRQIRPALSGTLRAGARACWRTDAELSETRRLLIGSYFLAEYSLESAALFNPSIVPHPDQSGPARRRAAVHPQPARHRRRTHLLHHVSNRHHPRRSADRGAAHQAASSPSRSQIPNPVYEKALFGRKLSELGLTREFTRRVMDRLRESFTLEELRAALQAEQFRLPDGMSQEDQHAAQGIWMLARSNYEVQFQPEQQLSERILFPATPSQRNGIEDARFVRFQNDDGTPVYYATFTAYDGRMVVPELVETSDFLLFRFITLNGPAAQNKGMALFPRKIDGLLCHALPAGQREHLPDVLRQRPLLERAPGAAPAGISLGTGSARQLRIADRDRCRLAGAQPRRRSDAEVLHRRVPAGSRRSFEGDRPSSRTAVEAESRTSAKVTCPTWSIPAAPWCTTAN